MQGDSAILDHVVVNVQTRLDAAAAAYGNLGFSLTERGHHTLGTSNHLALFQQDYVELLGVEAGRPNPGWDIVANAVGIQGLAFKTGDADALYRRLTEDRLPVQPPEEFSRPVTLPEGTFDARFRVVGVDPSPLRGVRVFFCQHLTPHLVWRREWQSHANGALGVAHLVVAVADPVRAGEAFARHRGAAADRGRIGDRGGRREPAVSGARGSAPVFGAGTTGPTEDRRRRHGRAYPVTQGRGRRAGAWRRSTEDRE